MLGVGERGRFECHYKWKSSLGRGRGEEWVINDILLNWIKLNNIKQKYKTMGDGQNELEFILIWNKSLSCIIIGLNKENLGKGLGYDEERFQVPPNYT